MKFIQRFAYYLIGFIVGIIFVWFIFTKKEVQFNYFPNARVLNNIRSKTFCYSSKASEILTQKWIDTIDIKKALQYGKVDFSKSKKDSLNGKLYVIDHKTTDNQSIRLDIINYSDRVVLENIIKK